MLFYLFLLKRACFLKYFQGYLSLNIFPELFICFQVVFFNAKSPILQVVGSNKFSFAYLVFSVRV